MSKPERFATFCEYCFREFEAKSILDAVRKTEEHEKTCDMRELIVLPQTGATPNASAGAEKGATED